jgi:tetratricopeptide (TPR) repeat protein
VVRFVVDNSGLSPIQSKQNMFNDTKEPTEFPAFHKKNISRKSAEKETLEVEKPLDVKENIENKFNYPFEFLSWHSGGDFYPELDAAVEFYNQKRYKTALDMFEGRPEDPARGFKNLICTFQGPIGWLLMANTKLAKDKFLNFCIANCYYKMGEYSKAITSLKNDDSERVLYLRAWCEYKLDKHEEAKENFKKVFYSNPRFIKYKNPYGEDYK